MLMNYSNTVIYAGVTNNLKKRIYEHRQDLVKGFTQRYKIHKLVYYEVYGSMHEAITREKQIKGGSRQKKIDLIKKNNPQFKDLYNDI